MITPFEWMVSRRGCYSDGGGGVESTMFTFIQEESAVVAPAASRLNEVVGSYPTAWDGQY